MRVLPRACVCVYIFLPVCQFCWCETQLCQFKTNVVEVTKSIGKKNNKIQKSKNVFKTRQIEAWTRALPTSDMGRSSPVLRPTSYPAHPAIDRGVPQYSDPYTREQSTQPILTPYIHLRSSGKMSIVYPANLIAYEFKPLRTKTTQYFDILSHFLQFRLHFPPVLLLFWLESNGHGSILLTTKTDSDKIHTNFQHFACYLKTTVNG